MLVRKSNFLEGIPMLRILIPFVIGIICYDYCYPNITLSSLLQWIWLPFILISIVLVLGKRLPALQNLMPIISIVCIMGISIGICATKDNLALKNKARYAQLGKSDYTLIVVNNDATQKEKTIKYDVTILAFEQDNKALKANIKGFLYTVNQNKAPKYKDGDTLMVKGQWHPIKNYGNPNEMNYQRYCSRKQIFLQLFANHQNITIIGRQDRVSILKLTNQYCIKIFEKLIPEKNSLALLKAMILGYEQDIDPQVRQNYSDTGIIHIVSISGAHVALLFAAINYVMSKSRWQNKKWLKLSISLLIIWFYVCLAGASTPAIRAALMFSIMGIGQYFEQKPNPLNHLLVAALILLLWQPMWLFQIGFQLSFIAVISLILFFQPLSQLFKTQNPIASWLINAAAASMAAEILVAPLVAYYFNSFPILFLIANLLASLFMTLILGLGMMLLICSWWPFVSKLIALVIMPISMFFHSCIQLLQDTGYSTIKDLYLSPVETIILYCCIVSLCAFLLRKNKTAYWIALCSISIFSLIQVQQLWIEQHQEHLVVYAQNTHPRCELIRGRQYQLISAEKREENFASKKAHIFWGCKPKQITGTEGILNAFIINQNKILILDSNQNQSQTAFPVDILVIASFLKINQAEKAINTFRPKQIVIAASIEQDALWRTICSKQNIKLHNTAQDGAFIYPL